MIGEGEDGVVEATESSLSVAPKLSLLPDDGGDEELTSSQFPLGLLSEPLGHLGNPVCGTTASQSPLGLL